ncbi:pyridine nucleotide-disulfide oxidoreductase [Pseudomonas taiwanensis]|uniref:NAD(P)/FAD-dependent oxidoreductase n=1 Tax=Pseudomonas taiwanensis TaxID=470150 RepID=UPI0015BFDE5C|nr:FAD-dependent oxidoreductase [Pseudomonas taiwanensis]NWL81019.1 pyridine nucleotide-disulfide oxidoreductase [Pseudomonas taiwanensis]
MTVPTQACAVIVGGGHAGSEAAVSLRQNGFDGRILIISDEPGLPYQRPPLSKAFLAGTLGAEALPIRPAATYEKSGIEILNGTSVSGVDLEGHSVQLADGSSLTWTHLVLATGSRARRLQVAGLGERQPDNLHYLRSQADAERLRDQLVEGQRLVIVGGGYIGLEVAAAAQKAGLKVTVLEAQPRVLARVTAPEVSSFYEQVHRAAGVELCLNAQLEQVCLDVTGQTVEALVTTDGTRIPVDLMLVGVGAIANTELAEQAGLAVENGILVDEFSRTSTADVYAIGDCSNYPSALYGCRMRLESIPNAIEQARAAASSITGKQAPYSSLPWFWSDQYDLKLQIAGINQGYDEVVLRGSKALRSFAAFYLSKGRLIAADCINRQQEFMAIKKLVQAGFSGDVELLVDESVSLKDLAASLPA